jgi:hypothetical protein
MGIKEERKTINLIPQGATGAVYTRTCCISPDTDRRYFHSKSNHLNTKELKECIVEAKRTYIPKIIYLKIPNINYILTKHNYIDFMVHLYIFLNGQSLRRNF